MWKTILNTLLNLIKSSLSIRVWTNYLRYLTIHVNFMAFSESTNTFSYFYRNNLLPNVKVFNVQIRSVKIILIWQQKNVDGSEKILKSSFTTDAYWLVWFHGCWEPFKFLIAKTEGYNFQAGTIADKNVQLIKYVLNLIRSFIFKSDVWIFNQWFWLQSWLLIH